MRLSLSTILLAAVVLWPFAGPARADGEGVLADVALQYANSRHGVVTYRVDTVTDVAGGPVHRHIEDSAEYALSEGTPFAKRYFSHVEDGKPTPAAGLVTKADEAPGPLARERLMLPYVIAARSDYHVAAEPAVAGGTRLRFQTTLCDASHGDGVMTLDARLRLTTVVFRPCKLPQHANGGLVTIAFAQVTSDMWDVASIVRVFTGRAFLVTGRAAAVSTYSEYRRHASASEARATLETASLRAPSCCRAFADVQRRQPSQAGRTARLDVVGGTRYHNARLHR